MIRMSKKCLFHAGFFVSLVLLFSCNNKKSEKDTIADTPAALNEKTSALLKKYVEKAAGNKVLSGDSLFVLKHPGLVQQVYREKAFKALWSKDENWLPAGDSLFTFIEQSKLYGLFPEDYFFQQLKETRNKFFADSLYKSDRKDALLWADADMMLTEAFFRIVSDIKIGRLPKDSVTLRKDSVLSNDFYYEQVNNMLQTGSVKKVIEPLEPSHNLYHRLKAGIKHFLDSADYREYSIVPYPEKNQVIFQKALQKRLYEGGYIAYDSVAADSVTLANAVKKFQQQKGLTVDGKAGEGTVRMLNVNDREKFVRIAISLDKYKLLPASLPDKYIWVNVAANYLRVMEKGEEKLYSRVISGKPKTKTPLLNGAVSMLITYPQWVPPPSIVAKEILPAVKKNPGYLARKGFSLLDKDGNEVDPYTVDWSKYTKTAPYRIVQGSGDANALGIMKFHFDNKYSVYLHDTNQRYLFGNGMRWLSHGCVRVQEWKELAFYILRNDNLNSSGSNSRIDSVNTWLIRKEKRNLSLKNKLPVFIRYITCEGKEGKIVFFDDIYGDDKYLRQNYFKGK
jgi:L,D-transpeptidase YcbB